MEVKALHITFVTFEVFQDSARFDISNFKASFLVTRSNQRTVRTNGKFSK